MSQQQHRRTAQDPAGHGGNEASRSTGAELAPHGAPRPAAGRGELPSVVYSHGGERPRLRPSERSGALPSLYQGLEGEPSAPDRRPMRSLGVHAILNTGSAEDSEPRGVRRSATEMEASASDVRPISLPPLSMSRPSSVEPSWGESRSPGASSSLRGVAPRRILTPRSPSLSRMASYGHLPGRSEPPPPVPVRARTYSVEQGQGPLPPLPTPPAIARAAYGYPPSAAPTPPPPDRGMTMSREAGPATAPSPNPSYRPVQQLHQPPGGPSYLGSSGQYISLPPQTGRSLGPPSGGRSSPNFLPISSSGGSNYQILTMPTHKGPVQIPVDVQAASKVADEKRKRNAGASARFRERRKMKEKEAAHTISRLEQQLRDATEDAEFYRRERDNLAGLVYQSPGGERHFPRPQSPRRTRAPGSPGSSVGGGDTASGSGSGSYTFSEMTEHTRRASTQTGGGERAVKRRTTGYTLVDPASTTASMPSARPTYASGFPPMNTTPSTGPSPQHPMTPSAARYNPAPNFPPIMSPRAGGPNAQLAPKPSEQISRPPDFVRRWSPGRPHGQGGQP